MKKLMIVAACAAIVAGCKSIEVERHAQTLATIQNADGTVSVVRDKDNNPVTLDGGWEVSYFQHWNWQRFDNLNAMAGKDVSLQISGYEGGADATNLTQLVHTSLDGLTKLIATAADAYVKVAGGGAQADTAIAVGQKIASYFAGKGGDATKAAVTVENGKIKVSDGTTCVECDSEGNCEECKVGN